MNKVLSFTLFLELICMQLSKGKKERDREGKAEEKKIKELIS